MSLKRVTRTVFRPLLSAFVVRMVVVQISHQTEAPRVAAMVVSSEGLAVDAIASVSILPSFAFPGPGLGAALISFSLRCSSFCLEALSLCLGLNSQLFLKSWTSRPTSLCPRVHSPAPTSRVQPGTPPLNPESTFCRPGVNYL